MGDTKEYLKMEFITENSKNASININNPLPQDNIDNQKVIGLGNYIADNNVFATLSGDKFDTVKSITRIVTTKTEIQ